MKNAGAERSKFSSRYQFLGHLNSKNRASASVSKRRILDIGGGGQLGASGRVAYEFPRSSVVSLIMEGTRRKKPPTAPYIERFQVREQLIFLLMFFCGLRTSELAHLFVHDIRYNEKRDEVEVVLAHPSVGMIWHCGKKITRAEFLRTEFGLLPRTKITGHKGAGWKNLQLVDSTNSQTFGFWISKDAANLFWQLHRLYIAKLRPSNLAHPYYFVNLDRHHAGDPLSIKKIQTEWTRCCERVGLLVSKELGTTPHGARAFYAGVLEAAGANANVRQVALHHRNPLSQYNYLRKSVGQVQRFLDEGAARVSEGIDFTGLDLAAMSIRSELDPLGLFDQLDR